jgi:hypothetical protein
MGYKNDRKKDPYYEMKAKLIAVVAVLIILVIIYVINLKRKGVTQEETEKVVMKTPVVVESPPQMPLENPKKVEKRKLTPPTNIVARADNGLIYVKWQDAPNATSYMMYYSNEPNFTKENARTIGGIDSGDFSINKVPEGRYYYRVASVKGRKESEWSPEGTIEVGSCTPNEPPKNIGSEIMESKDGKFDVFISWSADTTLDGYLVHLSHTTEPVGNESDFLIKLVEDSSATGHIFQGLDASLKWYAIVASNNYHCGSNSFSSPIPLN